MPWRLHSSQCQDCTTGISPDPGSLVGLGPPMKRWHVGTVGFRIDRQALRELRSDWPDSTTSCFHDMGDKDEHIYGVR